MRLSSVHRARAQSFIRAHVPQGGVRVLADTGRRGRPQAGRCASPVGTPAKRLFHFTNCRSLHIPILQAAIRSVPSAWGRRGGARAPAGAPGGAAAAGSGCPRDDELGTSELSVAPRRSAKTSAESPIVTGGSIVPRIVARGPSGGRRRKAATGTTVATRAIAAISEGRGGGRPAIRWRLPPSAKVVAAPAQSIAASTSGSVVRSRRSRPRRTTRRRPRRRGRARPRPGR